jgi:hypothetical protein
MYRNSEFAIIIKNEDIEHVTRLEDGEIGEVKGH